MTLRNLQVFLAIAECGNMTKAAEKLFISQPSVSLAVSEIEKTYNVVLFERLPGKLRLTPTGERLRNYAQRMLDIERDMDKFLSQESSNYCIRLGASITIGSSVISPIIARMRTEIPKVNYHVDIASTHEIEQLLLDGELDIALVEGAIKSPGLEVKDFISDKLVVICTNDHQFANREKIKMADLSGMPLILREQKSGTREQFDRAAKRSGIDLVVRFSSVSYGAIIDAVENDLGVGIISERLVKKYVDGGRLHTCEIEDADLSRDFKLVYRRDRYITDILDQFIRVCRDTNYVDDNMTI